MEGVDHNYHQAPLCWQNFNLHELQRRLSPHCLPAKRLAELHQPWADDLPCAVDPGHRQQVCAVRKLRRLGDLPHPHHEVTVVRALALVTPAAL